MFPVVGALVLPVTLERGPSARAARGRSAAYNDPAFVDFLFPLALSIVTVVVRVVLVDASYFAVTCHLLLLWLLVPEHCCCGTAVGWEMEKFR